MTDAGVVLVVDDLPPNVRLLDAVLTPRGFRVLTAASGEEALAAAGDGAARPRPARHPDARDRRLRGLPADPRRRPATPFLPVVMITASGEQEKLRAIEAGADDFVTKPFDQAELLARVRSLVRVKRYHDTIERQAAELAEWNRELEARVADAGRRAGAGRPAAPVPLPAGGRAGRARRRRRRSSRATAARSSSSSATCAASPRSRRPPSPRR